MKKRKFAVLTDSASDLPFDLAEKYAVDIMNFIITLDGKTYTEREDFGFDEYYDMLRTCEGLPVTSQVTSIRFLDAFTVYGGEGVEDVLVVTINGAGSATYENALMAKERFTAEHPESKMRIHVVDSKCYSMAYGWYVAEAARKLQNGAEMTGVVEWLEDVFSRTEICLAAYSLKFMKKSGRIRAAAAFAGELLGLKPVILMVDDGTTVLRKVRGDAAVLPAMLECTKERMDPDFGYTVGGTNDDQIAALVKLCEKSFKTPPVTTFKLGAAVATNTGPDAIAITYLGEKRPR